MHRKATILSMIAQKLGLQYADNGGSGIPVPRPFLGGNTAGFHYAPSPGDQVLVHHEAYTRPYPTATTSCTDSPQSLYPLISGESAILHADGRATSYLKSDGTTVIWSKTGKPSSTVDSNGNVTLGGNVTFSVGPSIDSNGIHNAQATRIIGTRTETTDANAISLTTGSWAGFWGAVTATVVDPNSLVEFFLECYTVFETTASNQDLGWSVQVDSAARYRIGGCRINTNDFASYTGGRAFITGLSAGAHSFQVEYFTGATSTTGWSLNAGSPNTYHWTITVLEHRN